MLPHFLETRKVTVASAKHGGDGQTDARTRPRIEFCRLHQIEFHRVQVIKNKRIFRKASSYAVVVIATLNLHEQSNDSGPRRVPFAICGAAGKLSLYIKCLAMLLLL